MKIQTQFPVAAFSGRMGKGNPLVAQSFNGEIIARSHIRRSSHYAESYQAASNFISTSAAFWKTGTATNLDKWDAYFSARKAVQFYWFPRTTTFGFFQKLAYYRQLHGGSPSFDIPDENNISIGNLWNIYSSPLSPEYVQLYFYSNLIYDVTYTCYVQLGTFFSEPPYNSCRIYGGQRTQAPYEFISTLNPKLNIFRVIVPTYNFRRFTSRFLGLRMAIVNADGFMLFHIERSISYNGGSFNMLQSTDLASVYIPYDLALLPPSSDSYTCVWEPDGRCIDATIVNNSERCFIFAKLPSIPQFTFKSFRLAYQVVTDHAFKCEFCLCARFIGSDETSWEEISPVIEQDLDIGDVFFTGIDYDHLCYSGEYEFAIRISPKCVEGNDRVILYGFRVYSTDRYY